MGTDIVLRTHTPFQVSEEVAWGLDYVLPFNIKADMCRDIFYQWYGVLFFPSSPSLFSSSCPGFVLLTSLSLLPPLSLTFHNSHSHSLAFFLHLRAGCVSCGLLLST